MLSFGVRIIRSMEQTDNIRRGRHCAFDIYVHLVFLTKCRGEVFDTRAIDRLRELFTKVCHDFGSQLVEMDGECDFVHLVVNYPPKVSISALVNSLKGASSRVLRKERPDISRSFYHAGVLWSPSYFAASGGGIPTSSIRQYVEQQDIDLATKRSVSMSRIIGTHKGRKAERWSDGKVFIWTGIRWIQEIGQEDLFVATA